MVKCKAKHITTAGPTVTSTKHWLRYTHNMMNTVSKGHSWGTGGWSAPVLERFAAWMQSKDRSYTTSKLLPRTFHVDICEQWQKKLVTFHSTGWLIRILLVDIDHVDMLTMLAWWGQSDLWSNSVEIFAVAGGVKSWAVESQSPEWWLTGIAQCPPPRWNQKASWAQCPRWHTSNKIHAIHAKLLCKNSKPMKKKWVNHWTLK